MLEYIIRFPDTFFYPTHSSLICSGDMNSNFSWPVQVDLKLFVQIVLYGSKGSKKIVREETRIREQSNKQLDMSDNVIRMNYILFKTYIEGLKTFELIVIK